jgi:membrane protein DedA with SNARE-associated domain
LQTRQLQGDRVGQTLSPPPGPPQRPVRPMDVLLELIANYGLLVVFVTVFLDQGGLPVPAYPPLIVTAALAADNGQSMLPILAVATFAAVLADLLWFIGGRRFGVRLLRLMCRLSLSPDSCVLMTRDIYARWGATSLIGAKFVPGFAAVATTLAGERRTPVTRFVFFDGLGALLWAGVAIALGATFHQAVNEVLLRLEDLGRYGLMLVVAVIAASPLSSGTQDGAHHGSRALSVALGRSGATDTGCPLGRAARRWLDPGREVRRQPGRRAVGAA